MNVAWLLAGLLLAIAAVAHGYVAERLTFQRIDTAALPSLTGQGGPDITLLELRGGWHVATALFLVSALVLLQAALPMPTLLPVAPNWRLLCPVFALAGILFIAVSLGREFRLSRLLRLPQGILMLVIAVLIYAGS